MGVLTGEGILKRGVACNLKLLVGCARSMGTARFCSIALAEGWRSMVAARKRVVCILLSGADQVEVL